MLIGVKCGILESPEVYEVVTSGGSQASVSSQDESVGEASPRHSDGGAVGLSTENVSVYFVSQSCRSPDQLVGVPSSGECGVELEGGCRRKSLHGQVGVEIGSREIGRHTWSGTETDIDFIPDSVAIVGAGANFEESEEESCGVVRAVNLRRFPLENSKLEA